MPWIGFTRWTLCVLSQLAAGALFIVFMLVGGGFLFFGAPIWPNTLALASVLLGSAVCVLNVAVLATLNQASRRVRRLLASADALVAIMIAWAAVSLDPGLWGVVTDIITAGLVAGVVAATGMFLVAAPVPALPNRCSKCGYDITGLHRCPECGTTPERSHPL